MPTPKLSKELALAAVAAVEANGNNKVKAAAALGIARGTLQGRLRAAALLGNEPKAVVNEPSSDAEVALRDRIFELESQARGRKESALTDEYVKRKILKLSDEAEKVVPPTWLSTLERGKELPGVPTVFFSDWHFGETVYASQINGVNEFNMEIAEKRVKTLIATTINLLRNHVVNPQYPGLVVALGGDFISGDVLHDELTESNEKPTMLVVLDLLAILIWAIKTLADEFGKVFLPCTSGNHGRNTRKPRAKSRNFSNWDWLLFQLLKRAFEGDQRVTFFIPDGPDASYTVCGHRYLLTHGDQFRSNGDAQIGSIGAIIRGSKRKLTRNTGIGLSFDTMICGHFHTYTPGSSIIVNGSLKGYDEFSATMQYGFEVPQQALWITHPGQGIRCHMPINLEPKSKALEGEEWVTWREATPTLH